MDILEVLDQLTGMAGDMGLGMCADDLARMAEYIQGLGIATSNLTDAEINALVSAYSDDSLSKVLVQANRTGGVL
jgi:hypothetical protein